MDNFHLTNTGKPLPPILQPRKFQDPKNTNRNTSETPNRNLEIWEVDEEEVFVYSIKHCD